MRKTIRTAALSGAAAAVMVAVSMGVTAQAADLDMYVAPPPPPVITWTGPYIGGFIGGGAHNVDSTLSFFNPAGPGTQELGSFDGLGGDGFLFGGFVGYNFQVSPQFVLGIQGDITVPDFESELEVLNTFNAKLDNDIVWSLSARAGWLPAPNTMLYVIGGWSHTEYDLKVSDGADSLKLDETFDGWHIGAGIETKLTDAVTARVEYRYTRYGSEEFETVIAGGPGVALDTKPVTHTGMVGIAYNFGSLF